MPKPDELPLLFLPRHLSPAAATHFIDALHQLIAATERHYAEQLRSYHHPNSIDQRDLGSPMPTDPPF